MSNPTNRLEAISLLRFLPPGAADSMALPLAAMFDSPEDRAIFLRDVSHLLSMVKQRAFSEVRQLVARQVCTAFGVIQVGGFVGDDVCSICDNHWAFPEDRFPRN